MSQDARPVFESANFDATLEPNEPTDGGKMTKTVWAGFHAAKVGQVVIDTFGSSFDTDLVVYRGTTFASFSRVVGDDDVSKPGFASKESLVQFTTTANADYRIQFGGKAGAEGFLSANLFFFPPTGGLAVFLASAGGTPLNGQDYVCTPTSFSSCPDPTFILYNSTPNKTLSVTPATSLGAGLNPPSPITLAPGAVKTVKFSFSPGFNKTTVRTVSGYFIFTAKTGMTAFSVTRIAGLIVVKPTISPPDVLRADASPQILAGNLTQPLAFVEKLTNSGGATVHGCHARTVTGSTTSVSFLRVNANGTLLGGLNQAFDLAPGATQTLKVIVRRQSYQLASVEATGTVMIDCADSAPLVSNLQNRIDTTNDTHDQPASVAASLIAPANGLVVVPAAGAGFRVAAVNQGVTRTVKAYPQYEHPPLETAANKQFAATICPLANATATACASPPAAFVQYNAVRGATHYFKVNITRPAVDPGYDPGRRRMFIYFNQSPVSPTDFLPLPVGAESVAVKRG